MKCINHPVSPAIGVCERCTTPLCGVCSHFQGDAQYCEKCAESSASAAFVDDRTETMGRPRSPSGMLVEDPRETARAEAEETRRRRIQIGIIATCALVLIAQFGFFLVSRNSVQPVSGANGLSAMALPNCLIVFQQIGQQLSLGREPDPTLRCEPAALPNRVTRTSAGVRVDHPSPQLYGFSEIFVSSAQPVPQLLE